MHLEKLFLKNVRQFEQAEYEFRKGFNLLVGENGFGKTTILRSILACLGSSKQAGGRNPALGVPDIRLSKTENELEVSAVLIGEEQQEQTLRYWRKIGSPVKRPGDKSDITVLFFGSNEALSSNLKGKSKKRQTRSEIPGKSPELEEQIYQLEHEGRHKKKYRGENDGEGERELSRSEDIRRFLEKALSKMSDRITKFHWSFEAHNCSLRRRNEDNEGQKAEAYFSRGFPDLILRMFEINPEILERIKPTIERHDLRSITITSDGYIEGYEELGLVSTPFEQFARTGLDLREEDTLSFVNSYVAEVKISPRIAVDDPNGSLPISQLSDGEQRLFSLFVDIAWTLSHTSFTAIQDSSAIVLIDEIDVHLHPKWQRTIVETLVDLFPHCQFIATTHSPFVVQPVEESHVQHLSRNLVGDFTDRGIEEIAVKVMGIENHQVSKRYLKMLDTAKEYFRVLKQAGDAEDSKEAKELRARLHDLSHRYAENPAYQAYLEMHGQLTLESEELK